MTKPLVVIGAGGHGREAVSLVLEEQRRGSSEWDLLGVLADTEPEHRALAALGVDWLGPVESIKTLETNYCVAIGSGYTRETIQRTWSSTVLRPATLIHWSASLGADVEWGLGCYVGAMSTMTTHVRLGEGVQVNVGCTLSHDVEVGDFATLAPGVRLTGGVAVGARASIFTGATVLPGVQIGSDAVVGAGAVVTRDVASGSTVVGVPARQVRRPKK